MLGCLITLVLHSSGFHQRAMSLIIICVQYGIWGSASMTTFVLLISPSRSYKEMPTMSIWFYPPVEMSAQKGFILPFSYTQFFLSGSSTVEFRLTHTPSDFVHRDVWNVWDQVTAPSTCNEYRRTRAAHGGSGPCSKLLMKSISDSVVGFRKELPLGLKLRLRRYTTYHARIPSLGFPPPVHEGDHSILTCCRYPTLLPGCASLPSHPKHPDTSYSTDSRHHHNLHHCCRNSSLFHTALCSQCQCLVDSL